MRLFLAATLLCATALHADPLTDVRTALGRLGAVEAIRATYEIQRATKAEGKFGNDNSNGKAAVELEGDANGFRVVFSRPLLEQVKREQLIEARTPKQKGATVNALRQVDPVAATDSIDYAPALLRMLDGAKVLEDKPGAWQGKPVRTVVFRLADRPDEDDGPGKFTVAENRLTLLLAADHVPVAGEHRFSAKISFLIFHGELKQTKSWQFGHIGDRLVRLREEEQQSGSGMGQKTNDHTIATVKVHT
jgi:hypothetical protein